MANSPLSLWPTGAPNTASTTNSPPLIRLLRMDAWSVFTELFLGVRGPCASVATHLLISGTNSVPLPRTSPTSPPLRRLTAKRLMNSGLAKFPPSATFVKLAVVLSHLSKPITRKFSVGPPHQEIRLVQKTLFYSFFSLNDDNGLKYLFSSLNLLPVILSRIILIFENLQ